MVIPSPSRNEFGLYFHIPFCTRKCGYCHFYVVADDAAAKERLVAALTAHWRKCAFLCEGKQLVSLYFGGGTPSLLTDSMIASVIAAVGESHDLSNVEVTLEANPEQVTKERAAAFKAAGVNRLSMGVQSFDSAELLLLTRRHSSSQAAAAVEAANAGGIENISIDLMYELPDQTLASWQRTLHAAAQLPISHLSLYNLTIEPESAFYRKKARLEAAVPEQEVAKEMYLMARENLASAGLVQYEISAFAKEGLYSRHNSGYWQGRPFLGLGPSAFSYWQGKRFKQVSNLRGYCKAVEEGEETVDFSEELAPLESMRELLAVRLRLLQGVDIHEIGAVDDETVDRLETLVKQGFLKKEPPLHYSLSEKGVLFYDDVAASII